MIKIKTLATILLTVPILYATPISAGETNIIENIDVGKTNEFHYFSPTNSTDRLYNSLDKLYVSLVSLNKTNLTNNIKYFTEIETNKTNTVEEKVSSPEKEITNPKLLEGQLSDVSLKHSQNPELNTQEPIKTNIRDSHYKKVGKIETKKTIVYDSKIPNKVIATGSLSIIYDKDGNKIASVHRIGNNTVYRIFEDPNDKEGKEIKRKQAREMGLR